MASTTITAAATASTSCSGPQQYELPVRDAACGIPNTADYESIFDKCAKPAGVRPYHNDCALYALAVDQSVQDLINCLYGAGVEWQDVWCTGETNATATATSYPKPAAESSTSTEKGSPTSSTSSPEASSTDENGAIHLAKGALGVKYSLALLCLVISAFVV